MVALATRGDATYSPTSREWYAGGLVNGIRARQGIRALSLDRSVSECLHRHAARMAAAGELFHTGGRCHWGSENVGNGSTMVAIHRAFLGSDRHRRNLYCSCARQAIGVVRDGRTYWLAELYW